MIALWLWVPAVAGPWWDGSIDVRPTEIPGEFEASFFAAGATSPTPMAAQKPRILHAQGASVLGDPQWREHPGGPLATVTGLASVHVDAQWVGGLEVGTSTQVFTVTGSVDAAVLQAASWSDNSGSIVVMVGPNQDLAQSSTIESIERTDVRVHALLMQAEELGGRPDAPGLRALAKNTGGSFFIASSPEDAVSRFPELQRRLRERIRLSVSLCRTPGAQQPTLDIASDTHPSAQPIPISLDVDAMPACESEAATATDVSPVEAPADTAATRPPRAVAAWRWIVAACLIAIGAGTMGWVLLRKRPAPTSIAPKADAPNGHLIQPHPTPDSADAPTLRVTRGPGIEGQIIRLQASSMAFGDDDDCAVIIEGLSLASTHATFERFPGNAVFVTDQSGLGGTWVNGERLDAKERRRIHHGDAVQIGPHLDLVFELPGQEST